MTLQTFSLPLTIAFAMFSTAMFSTAGFAEPILFTHQDFGTTSTPSGASPKKIILEVGEFESPRTGFAVEGVTPDPVERILQYKEGDPPSRTWLITEVNAGDFGLDWGAFESAMLGHVARRSIYLNLGDEPARFGEFLFYPDVFPRPNLRLKAFDLERIEIDLDYWFFHPTLESLWAHRVEARVYGDGVVVPEPSALVLATLTPILLCLMRRR